MRKKDLRTDIDYVLWNGGGSLKIPVNLRRAVRLAQRVRVLDATAGVRYQLLDREDGAGVEGEAARGWEPNARNFVMPWSEFEAMVKPAMEAEHQRKTREKFLDELSEKLVGAMAISLDLQRDRIHADVSEYHRRDGTVSESVDVSIEWKTIKELQDWLEGK